MTVAVATDLTQTPGGAGCFCITLQAPRANALEPGLLAALDAALDAAEAADVPFVLLAGGRNFSSGGDVARFLAAAERNEAEAYAAQVVPALQRIVARMLAMPAVVATALRGAATGGAAGLVFAADLAVAAPDAFVQPYYRSVGFAPDGGWTAVLPERIGAGPARDWLRDDTRHGAAGLQALGLVAAVDPAPEARALALMDGLNPGAALAAKALIWDAARRAQVGQRLAAETEAFLARISTADTRAGMARFVDRSKVMQHV